jgi:hypothetical protein
MEKRNQISLFAAPREKGSSEWSAFDAVREDKVGAFRVKIPEVKQNRYSNVTVIKRNTRPASLFFKGAR